MSCGRWIVSFAFGCEAAALRVVDAVRQPRCARVITYRPVPRSIIALADRASDVTPHARRKRSKELTGTGRIMRRVGWKAERMALVAYMVIDWEAEWRLIWMGTVRRMEKCWSFVNRFGQRASFDACWIPSEAGAGLLCFFPRLELHPASQIAQFASLRIGLA